MCHFFETSSNITDITRTQYISRHKIGFDAKIQRYRAPDSLLDFLMTLRL